MRKILILAIAFMILTGSVHAADMDKWYLYNTSGKIHNFSVSFPTDWKAQNISDSKHGFSPSDNFEDPFYIIQEFEGQSFEQVIEHYRTEGGPMLSFKDFIFQSSSEDIIAREVIYDKMSIKMIKRGTVIFTFLPKNNQEKKNEEVFDNIFNSFHFSDNWHQYIDLGENYSFIFPKNMDLNTINNGVEILDEDITVFSVLLQEDGELKNKEKNYHIDVDEQNSSFTEIMESFNFFDIDEIEEDYSSFLYFPDVRDNHKNSTAINRLVKDKVIEGYLDGTFKPNGEINRAELTKMVVATKNNPDPSRYSNCFPDVVEEWFAPYICYAKNRRWVTGYQDGSFKPESSVNRVEALKIILEALINYDINAELEDESITDIDTEMWYGSYYSFASNNNLLDTEHVINNKYIPDGNISRKEVAEIIYRIQQMP